MRTYLETVSFRIAITIFWTVHLAFTTPAFIFAGRWGGGAILFLSLLTVAVSTSILWATRSVWSGRYEREDQEVWVFCALCTLAEGSMALAYLCI